MVLGTTVSSWKRFTARQANVHLGRTGPFWQTEYWDRFIRNETHFATVENYIDQNPVDLLSMLVFGPMAALE